MFEVDRIVAIIRPTNYMLEWLKQLPKALDNMVLRNLQKDCTALLIPAFDGPKQAQAYIDHIYQGLFEAELESWGVPKKSWPKDRSLELFNKFYDIEFHSMVYDIAYLEQRQKERQA